MSFEGHVNISSFLSYVLNVLGKAKNYRVVVDSLTKKSRNGDR
jgi:hypothetical protein